MPRLIAISAAALLAATPAAALSVSVAACNEHSARLVADETGATLTVNGTDVPIEQDAGYRDLLCVTTKDGGSHFGFTALSVEDDERHFLVDPETLEVRQITYEEADLLEFWDDPEDDLFGEDEELIPDD